MAVHRHGTAFHATLYAGAWQTLHRCRQQPVTSSSDYLTVVCPTVYGSYSCPQASRATSGPRYDKALSHSACVNQQLHQAPVLAAIQQFTGLGVPGCWPTMRLRNIPAAAAVVAASPRKNGTDDCGSGVPHTLAWLISAIRDISKASDKNSSGIDCCWSSMRHASRTACDLIVDT